MIYRTDNSEDVRKSLDLLNDKDITVSLHINRTPMEFEPSIGTVDDLILIYLAKTCIFHENFAQIWTKNTTHKPLKKGILEHNVYPTENNAIEKIWAQIGYRIDFIKDRGLNLSFYLEKEKTDLTKKLPQLPYAVEQDFTLDEIMQFAEKEYLGYCKFIRLLNDDGHEAGIMKGLTKLKLVNSA